MTKECAIKPMNVTGNSRFGMNDIYTSNRKTSNEFDEKLDAKCNRNKDKYSDGDSDVDSDGDSDSNSINDSDKHNILDESNYIGPIADKMIKDFIMEVRKEKNMNRLRNNILNPVLHDINDRFFPHMVAIITLMMIIIILLTVILIINMLVIKERPSK